MIDQGQAGGRIRTGAQVIASVFKDRATGKNGSIRIRVSELREITGLPSGLVRRAALYAERCGLIKLAAVQNHGVVTGRVVHDGSSKLKRIGGHLYIIEFTGGIIKVGYSSKPKERLQTHRNTASIWAQTEVRNLVSPYFDNARAAEGYLIQAACYFADRIHGEWFRTTSTEVLFQRIELIFQSINNGTVQNATT